MEESRAGGSHRGGGATPSKGERAPRTAASIIFSFGFRFLEIADRRVAVKSLWISHLHLLIDHWKYYCSMTSTAATAKKLAEAFDAVEEAKGILLRLATWQTAERIFSKAGRALLAEILYFLLVEAPPVAVSRLGSLKSALVGLSWNLAFKDPRKLAASLVPAVANALGGTLIKLSQVVAHSPAFFPDSVVEHCNLSVAACDGPGVPRVPDGEIRRHVAAELGVDDLSSVFSCFDSEPLASASIAQVHAATLKSSDRSVVVKVVRPGVRERLAIDLRCAELLARALDLVMGPELVLEFVASPLQALVADLREAILGECDLARERTNMEAYRRWLRESRALHVAGLAGSVFVPDTFGFASSAQVLTMERVDGVMVSELQMQEMKDGRRRRRQQQQRRRRRRKEEQKEEEKEQKVEEEEEEEEEQKEEEEEEKEEEEEEKEKEEEEKEKEKEEEEEEDQNAQEQNDGHDHHAGNDRGSLWHRALARALAVSCLSILDGVVFHGDLHAGNMIYRRGTGDIAFIDFGVCGVLPRGLRGALLLQAISFVVGDTHEFSNGFAYALQDEACSVGTPATTATTTAASTAASGSGGNDGPAWAAEAAEEAAAAGGSATPPALDTEALTRSLEPLFKEFEGINPLAPGADGTIDPALFDLMFRGQMVLHKHGVQLPREFTLLMKTAVFGTRFFATFSGGTTDRHRSELRYLSFCMARAVGGFVVCNATLMYGLVSPATGRKLALVGAHRAVDASRRAARRLAKRTTDGARAVVSYSYNSCDSYFSHFSYSVGLVSTAGPKTGAIAVAFVCAVTCATCCAVVLVYYVRLTATTQDVGSADNARLMEAADMAGGFAKAQSAAADAGKNVTDMLAAGSGPSGGNGVGAGMNLGLASA